MEGSPNIPSPRKSRVPSQSCESVPLITLARQTECPPSWDSNREDASLLKAGELGDRNNASRATSPDTYSFIEDEEDRSSLERLIESSVCHRLPGSLRDLEETSEIDNDEFKAHDDSPYEEVRAAVSNTDDPDMPCVRHIFGQC